MEENELYLGGILEEIEDRAAIDQAEHLYTELVAAGAWEAGDEEWEHAIQP